MEFTAEQVWGAAVAADRINGGYIKEDVWVFEGGCKKRLNQANKAMVKSWLRDNDFVEVTAQDYQAGVECRNHFKSYLMRTLAGTINEFETQAMRLAAKDTFTSRDLFDFAVISCLPNSARMDQKNQAIKREIWESTSIGGEVGSTIIGDITVLNNRWNSQYGKYRITARMNDSVVDFWNDKAFTEGETVHIKARIKCHRDNNTTQLNYVKRA
jgi:hypothetical protein